MEETTLLLKM